MGPQCFACVVVLGVIALGVHALMFGAGAGENLCAMTYNRGWYEEISQEKNFSRLSFKYRVLRYRDGPAGAADGGKVGRRIPVVFVPGHKGSFKQVRSIVSVGRTMDTKDLKLDFYALDFWDESPGVVGFQVLDQADFLNDATRMIRRTFYEEKDIPIIIVGHSMGGFVARASYLMKNFDTAPRRSPVAIFTLATPHIRAAYGGDRTLNTLYSRVNRVWKLAAQEEIISKRRVERGAVDVDVDENATCDPDEGNRTCSSADVSLTPPPSQDSEEGVLRSIRETIVVSVAGGRRDLLVPSSMTNIISSNIVTAKHGMSVLSSRVRLVSSDERAGRSRASCDHLSILWCNQLLKPLVRAMRELARDSATSGVMKLIAEVLLESRRVPRQSNDLVTVVRTEAQEVMGGGEAQIADPFDAFRFKVGRWLRLEAESLAAMWVAVCLLLLSTMPARRVQQSLGGRPTPSDESLMRLLHPASHLPFDTCAELFRAARRSSLPRIVVIVTLLMCGLRESARAIAQSTSEYLPDFARNVLRDYALFALDSIAAWLYDLWTFVLNVAGSAFHPLSMLDVAALYLCVVALMTAIAIAFRVMSRISKRLCCKSCRFPLSVPSRYDVAFGASSVMAIVFGHFVQVDFVREDVPEHRLLPLYLEARPITAAREIGILFVSLSILFVWTYARAAFRSIACCTDDRDRCSVYRHLVLMTYLPLPAVFLGTLSHALGVLVGPTEAATRGTIPELLLSIAAIIVPTLHLRSAFRSVDNPFDDANPRRRPDAGFRPEANVVCERTECPTAVFARVGSKNDGSGSTERIRFEDGEEVFVGTTYVVTFCECPKYFRKMSRWCDWCLSVYGAETTRGRESVRGHAVVGSNTILVTIAWLALSLASGGIVVFVASARLLHRLQYAYFFVGAALYAMGDWKRQLADLAGRLIE
eukprot:g147.t1